MVSERSPDCVMLYKIECLLEVDRCRPDVSYPFSPFLSNKSVRPTVVRCLEFVSGSCLVGTLVLIEFGLKLVVFHCREELEKVVERHRSARNFFGLVYHCDHDLFP